MHTLLGIIISMHFFLTADLSPSYIFRVMGRKVFFRSIVWKLGEESYIGRVTFYYTYVFVVTRDQDQIEM